MSDLVLKKTIGLPLTGSQSYDSALKKINSEAELTPEGLRRYFDDLRDRGLSVSTINHKIAALKKSLKIMAEKMGHDSWKFVYELERIFEQSNLKRVKVETIINPDDCLTMRQLKKIIESADDKTSVIIRALYVTACRVSELVNIRYNDCYVDKNGVSILVIGKGRKQRTVFMGRDLYHKIMEIFAGKAYLFETRTSRAMHRANVWKMVSRAGESAGIERLHPHTLRHTWATHNLERLGLHKVSQYLGHAEVSTTSKFYIHSTPKISEILKQGELF